MGGLRKKTAHHLSHHDSRRLAIAGIPPFAGFFSKDAILYAAFSQGSLVRLLYFVGLFTALLTAFYMFRLWYLTFTRRVAQPADATRMRARGPCSAR